MSDLALGISVAGVADAINALQRVGQAVGATEQQTQRTQQTTRQAQAANDAFGSSAREVAQRVQGMASQVASLAGRLGGGSVGQAAGLVASLAGVTANALAMGATMGPAGIVVGALSGLVPLVADLTGANETAALATDTLTSAERNFSIASGDAVTAIDNLVSANRRLAQSERERQMIDQGLGSVDQQYAAANLAGARVGRLSAQDSALRQERERLDQTDWQNAERLHEIDTERAALAVQIRDARAESARLGQLAVTAAEDEAAIQSDLVTTARDQELAEASAADHAERHATASREIATHTERAAISAAQAARAEQTFLSEMMDAAGTSSLPGLGFGEAASDDIIAQLAGRTEHATTATRALISAQHDLAASARPTNAALESVASTVGGTFQSAFQGAIGAWLDGSKSFVQAAEAMAKGVIKALVTEAIVQGVVELARGIADLASYQYVTAGQHFAAAAAWAAVGVAAGGVGAAVGAFGGGAAQSQGATTRDTASASRESAANGGPTVANFYIYPGGFITKGEVSAGVVDALNHYARNGLGPGVDPRAIRQAA